MKTQTQKDIINKLNKKIDDLIIKGKTQTTEYKRLERLHYLIVKNWQVITTYNKPVKL